jgi:hypothetical protein
LQDGRTNAVHVQPGFSQQLFAAGMVLEGIGQAKMQDRHLDILGREQFGDAGTSPTRNDVVL